MFDDDICFDEVTAIDQTKAEIVLNTICAMFSGYCAKKFTVEPVEVIDSNNKSKIYPNLETKTIHAEVEYLNKSTGLSLSPEQISKLLTKMSLTPKVSPNEKEIIVNVPCTRSDIIHACDVYEDLAIAYGYNNLPRNPPAVNTEAKQTPINKLSDMLRQNVAYCGYSEVLTLSLCSKDELYTFLRRPDEHQAVVLSNPQSIEYQVGRTSLIPGMLKTVNHNKQHPLPLRLFEISDVMFLAKNSDVGARNQRNFCSLYCGMTSGNELTHGLLDRFMQLMRVSHVSENSNNKMKYSLKSTQDPVMFPGLGADIYLNDKKIGVLGSIHPEVLEHFGIVHPCSLLELNLEPFL